MQKKIEFKHRLVSNVATAKALVVDDSATSRTLLTKILKKKGIHCEQASSGEDALAHLTWYQPDYIFLDHLMPGLDGFETLKRIKSDELTRHIPVIMYTSQHAHNYYEEAHRLGAAGVISKQIDRDKLYLMLDRLCFSAPNKTEDVPTVFREAQHTLSSTVERESSSSKLYARISTLETAYEELHEESRTLKSEFSRLLAEHTELTAKRHRLQAPQVVFTLFLAISLFASTFAWFTSQKIDQSYKSTQIKIERVNELIDEIIHLLESNDQSNTP